MMLKEADRLADDLGVNVVAEIGDGGVSDILNFRRAQIFGDGLDAKNHEQREKENRFDVVETGRKEGIEINRVIGEWNFSERESGTDYGWIENVIDCGLDHQRDQAFGQRDDCQENDTRSEPQSVRPLVSQQSLQLW